MLAETGTVCLFSAPMHQDLIDLLRRRESVIADHPWRDRDPAGHLEGLKDVSMGILAWMEQHEGELDPRLRHFLENASFAKALAFLEAKAGK